MPCGAQYIDDGARATSAFPDNPGEWLDAHKRMNGDSRSLIEIVATCAKRRSAGVGAHSHATPPLVRGCATGSWNGDVNIGSPPERTAESLLSAYRRPIKRGYNIPNDP